MNYLFFRLQITEIEEMTEKAKMLDFIYTGGIRTCGYYEDVEAKYKKKYPKTYKRYEEAKSKWFYQYDKCLPIVEDIKEKDKIRLKNDTKKRLEKAEKEIKELRKMVDNLK